MLPLLVLSWAGGVSLTIYGIECRCPNIANTKIKIYESIFKQFYILHSLNPLVAEDPSGATDCATHGINKDFVHFSIFKQFYILL